MKWIARRLATWLAPYILEDLEDVLKPLAYKVTVIQEMTEELAHAQGLEVVFDLQTGVVTVLPLNKN